MFEYLSRAYTSAVDREAPSPSERQTTDPARAISVAATCDRNDYARVAIF